MDEGTRKPLGQILVEKGKIPKSEVEKAIVEQAKSGEKIGSILVKKGFITENELLEILSGQYGIDSIDLRSAHIDKKLFNILPYHYCIQKMIVPLEKDDNTNTIKIAMADPSNYSTINEIRFITECEVEVYVALEKQIEEVLGVSGGGSSRGEQLNIEDEDEEDAPIIKLAREIITDAVNRGASDIHLEYFENAFRLRYRIDGILHNIKNIDVNLHPPLISRIKIMADLDISEKRLPQDGRIKTNVGGRDIDLRVSVIPCVHGENIVMRILDKEAFDISIDAIGFNKKEKKLAMQEIEKPHGMFLLSGPTGSGKTTTLYAFLKYLVGFNKKILTVEDPVEYRLDGINQVQVHHEIGLTFSAGLRAFLRHDPDVIMVGEIRDRETAEIAIRAALTGHLVLSTVHTNDSPSALTRFVDMGIKPYLVSATFNIVISQRLVRRLCDNCKKKRKLKKEDIKIFGEQKILKEGEFVYEAVGCNKCGGSGYKGRIAIFEIMTMNEAIKDALIKGKTLSQIRQVAIKSGMTTLKNSGLRRIKDGETTISEVMRVVPFGE